MGNCCCKSGAAGAIAATQSDRGDGGNPSSGIGKGTGRSTLNGGSGVGNGKQGASVITANQHRTCCFVASLGMLSLSKACHRLVVLVDLARPTQTTVQWKAHRPSKSPWL
jgi:hypothetical protein